MRILLSSLIFLTFLALPARAERDAAQVYAFGNSLVHHLTESDETTVPHWLALMALADRRDFRLSGQWGFLRDFARLPPEPNWSFGKVREAWNSGRFPFEKSGVDTIWITPANFIQDGPPDRPFQGENPTGASPLSATLEVIDWVAERTPGARVMIYEGWPDMGPHVRRFPPRPLSLRKYHDFAQGDYAEWFDGYVSALRDARPGVRIELLPVSTALSQWLTGPLKALPTEALYVDSAPHGTANLYFLASLVAYAALYEAPAPRRFQPPDTIHPTIRAQYQALAAEALEVVTRHRGAAAPVVAPVEAEAAAPEPAAPEGDVSLAARGLADPSLSIGLNGIADWSSQQPFLDLFKTARPWTGHLPGQWGGVEAAELEAGGHLDADGWPLRVPEGVTKLETFLLTDMPEDARDLAGRYVMRWQGTGDIRLGGRAQNVRYSYSERQAVFDYTPGDGGVSVSFTETEEGDPIRAISIVREDRLAMHAAGALFNPDWLARIGDLRGLRFMDWMFTNGSEKRGWADRARIGDYTWGRRGVPVEVMVRLANVIGADPWFNMPHMADDDYVERFATLVRDRLDPRLRAHVEYSNELWNFIFPQTAWARDRAVALWGEADDDRWMQFAGGRAAEVAQIWSGVYGAGAQARLVNVIAVHTGWPGLEEAQLEAPLWREEVAGRLPPASRFDAYAVAGYFGYELGEEDNTERLRDWLSTSRIVAEAAAEKLPEAQRETALARMQYDIAIQLAAAAVAQGSLAELTGTLLPYHGEVARRYGLDMVMYEGGSHVTGVGEIVNDEATAGFFTRLNYAPEMAMLYEALIRGWKDAGGQSFNAFVDVAVPTKWGSWGALRHLSDDNPRWAALMEANRTAPHWAEARADGTFLHGVVRTGGDGGEVLTGTVEEDVLIVGAGDDRIVTGGGADRVHGGDGRDVAVMQGARDDYTLAMVGESLVLTRDGVETWLTAVEQVRFADGAEMDVAAVQ